MAITKRAFSATALAMCSFFAQAGEQCEDNFVSSGSILTGQNYKSGAVLNNTNLSSAFERALQFTATTGFDILSSDKNTGLISAVKSTSAKGGVRHPLTIAMRADGANTVMAISFTLTGLALASADDVKKHFCSTVAAATSGSAVAASDVQQPAAASRPAQRRALVGYASIAPEQQKAVEAALMKSIPNDRIGAMVTEAKQVVAAVAERLSCLSTWDGRSAMNEFAAPNSHFVMGLSAPMAMMQYHDKAFCLTVLRINGWEAPANNALKYEVMFKAEDSGETRSHKHEIVRQTDGTWLFRN
jgi:hypothetical protein